MIHTRRVFTLSICGALVSTVLNPPVEAKDQEDWQFAFCLALQGLASAALLRAKIATEEQIASQTAALKMAAKAFESNYSVPAIFELWIREETDNVELQWWKKDERVARMFAMALFICEGDQPLASVPDFSRQLLRFSSDEREQRADEIKFVMTHRFAIARVLALALKNRGKEESQMYKNFKGVGEERMGEELRCPHGKGSKP